MDTQQGNGLTLEALAQRLEGLQRESAERLETQTQRLEALERENTELRSKVATLEGSGTRRERLDEMRGSEARKDREPVSVLEGQVSRRSLLSKAGAAAVAAVAAGTLLNPRQAKAHDDNDTVLCDAVFTHFVSVDSHGASNAAVSAKATTDGNWAGYGAVDGQNLGEGPGVRGRADSAGVEGIANAITGAGVEGRANGSLGTGVRGTGGFIGVDGFGNVGVRGTGTDAQQAGVKGEGVTGVWGITTTRDFAGVYGENKGTKGIGTVGIGKGADAGVLGRNLDTDGIGVQGTANTTAGKAGVKGEGSTGVWGLTSRDSFAGVYGEHTGTSGHGTVGIGKGGLAGVLGRNGSSEGVRGEGPIGVRGEGGVIGVRGESTQADTSGVYGINVNGKGVQGSGKTGVLGRGGSDYGGQFEGGRAQLMLVPAGRVGKPTSGTHKQGEIYMDKAGTLFVCVAATTSTAAAKWRKVSTTAV